MTLRSLAGNSMRFLPAELSTTHPENKKLTPPPSHQDEYPPPSPLPGPTMKYRQRPYALRSRCQSHLGDGLRNVIEGVNLVIVEDDPPPLLLRQLLLIIRLRMACGNASKRR